MGKTDVERQHVNVEKMKMLGATVIPVTSGNMTLKDATNEAIRDWCCHPADTYYIDVLAFHICFPHIDDAFHIHQCTDGSCCHAMLSGSRLGNDTCFSHAARQKYLPDGVVYFMGSRMIEVLSFQVYFTSIFFREAACQIEWGRTAHIITQ